MTTTMVQTTFAFVVEKAGDALDGSQVLIVAPTAEEADRLAAIRSKLWSAPLRRCGEVLPPAAKRGAA